MYSPDHDPTEKMVNLVSILRTLRDDIWDARIKMVRHATAKYDLNEFRRLGFFDEYEARQGKPKFHDCDYLLSFLGEGRTRSRFLHCCRVRGVDEAPGPYPRGFPYPDMGPGNYRYLLQHEPGFESLEDRLVIDWGAGQRSWVQRLSPKPVIEILPAGHVADFPGYSDIVLDWDEMVRVIDNPDANRVWHTMLGGVAGVYLIADTADGRIYVGSAYGADGILGRWRSYAKRGHGGNKLLRELLTEHPERHRAFRFSILQTLPKTMTQREVIAVESLYKRKLGTRAFGLNAN